MKRALLVGLVLFAGGLLCWSWLKPAPSLAVASPATDALGFRITFGEKQERPRDYSATLALSTGKVAGLVPWRFFGGDQVAEPASWKLQIKRTVFEHQPDRPVPVASMIRPDNLVPAGVDVAVQAPSTATATIQSDRFRITFSLADLTYQRVLHFEDRDVTVQRTPVAQSVSPSTSEQHDYPSIAVTRKGEIWVAWQAYEDRGDHVYARRLTDVKPFQLTAKKGDVFRTAIAEDAKGNVWVVWSERIDQEWRLYARSHDGSAWSDLRKLTSGWSPNIFHRLVAGPAGELHLVWVAHQKGRSYVMWSKYEGVKWSQPKEISGASAWVPDAAVDSKGNLYVAWDSYRAGNYDIFYRRIAADGALGPVEPVTRSPVFQAHPTVAVDKQDRLWVAWDESGANWGKDWSHDDPFRAIVLYTDRRPQVAVLDGGTWKRPEGELMSAVPRRYSRYIQLPRVACDATGRIWMLLQLRTAAGNSRDDFWAAGGRWEYFLTTLEGNRWTPLMPVPRSSSRPEGPVEIQRGGKGIWLAWANDNRPFGPGAGFAEPVPAGYEICAGWLDSPAAPPPASLVEFQEPQARHIPVHPNEAEEVARVRGYRASVGGVTYQIVRGDFHRHTEISGDGAGDGSLEDYFRYMIEVAEMDTGIVGDHNAGNDNEYTWWRTEKALDLFFIEGRFTPLFGYERSVPYPNGHRNVVFPRRGVRTLPIGREEAKGVVNSGKILYPYLRENRGIAMLHSLATGQGSDYRDNDPELEPLVELYQGYHASYEYEGAPLAETGNHLVTIHGAYQPAGFWWNALAKGLKLGVQASSDHIATHNSYAMIYTPRLSRGEIVESMRKRHAYAATDNIIVDFRAIDAQEREYLMGDAFTTKTPPKLSVKILGTNKLTQVEIIKDQRFVFRTEPGSSSCEFTYVDKEPARKESYYYVRAMQIDRNMAWSSPVWVKYE